MSGRIRADRWLVTLGAGSRSEVGRMIRSGAFTANGVRITDPAAQLTGEELLTLRGEKLDGRLMRHVILNKPAGILTAARDKKQKTVMDLLPPVYGAIGCMPVGRLDKDTTGILLFTCDGEMNHRLLSPKRHVDKTYRAEIGGHLSAEDIARFRTGLDLGDFTADPAEPVVLERKAETDVVRLTIHEGKFHQVRRMFSAVGHEVLQLHRERFGPLTPEGLAEGAWRELTGDELNALRAAARMTGTEDDADMDMDTDTDTEGSQA